MHALEVGCDVHTAMALLELGSVRWMAPEIYDAELIGKERGSPSAESDCHSFGMLILEVSHPHLAYFCFFASYHELLVADYFWPEAIFIYCPGPCGSY